MSCLWQGINWDDLANKKLAAPFVPKIKNEMDVSNFSDEFTNMAVNDSPAIVPLQSDKIFKVIYSVEILFLAFLGCRHFVALLC